MLIARHVFVLLYHICIDVVDISKHQHVSFQENSTDRQQYMFHQLARNQSKRPSSITDHKINHQSIVSTIELSVISQSQTIYNLTEVA